MTHIPTIDELIELPEITGVQISPNGHWVAYTLSTPNWEEDEYKEQIWLASTEAGGSNPRQLTFGKGSSSQPRWSPDGEWLAFLSKREGDEHTQIYRISPFGGEAERLSNVDVSPQNLIWSHQGTSIAFLATEVESDVEKKRKETYGEYHVEDKDHTYTHLWIMGIEDRKVQKITSGKEHHIVAIDWSPGGQQIAFQAAPTPDIEDHDRSRVYLVNLANLHIEPLTGEGSSSPRWSPDGDEIACTQEGEPSYYKNSHITIISASDKTSRQVIPDFDEIPWLQAWGPGYLYFLSIQRTSAHLYRVDPRGNAPEKVTPSVDQGWTSLQASFNHDYTKAALVFADAEHLPEVGLFDLQTGAFSILTDHTSKVKDWELGASEVFTWNSKDGTPIEGVLTRPGDFDPQKKNPLLVIIHGGPSWVSFLVLLSNAFRRVYPAPLWMAKNALILQPNYRGSAGYGEQFRALNVRNLGVGDSWDVLSGVDALIAKGWVDPDRVGVMGWSQGGYISAYLTTTSNHFQAVSVGAGISNWMTYYVNTDIHPFTRQYLEATPWDEPEIYAQTSPMTFIKQAQTPTLIQHGEFDKRVPTSNAYELYQGLKDIGVETKLVIYKGQGHGIGKPRLNRQAMQENLSWFNRWIWGEEDPGNKAVERTCYVAAALGEQNTAPTNLKSFPAQHVVEAYRQSQRDEADFHLFAGRAGLIAPFDPPSDFMLNYEPEEVGQLALRVARQLGDLSCTKLIVFTPPADKDSRVWIDCGFLQIAAGLAGIKEFKHQEG